MKNILLIALLINNISSYSQVGIGTTTPQGSLEITSTTDGLLIPRIALSNTTTATVLTPTKSEMVYNTDTAGDVTPGYYYWETTPTVASNRWVRIAAANTDWSLNGNAGTTAGTNFIGTTDAQDLRIKTGVGGIDRWNISNTNNGQLQSYSLGSSSLPTYSWQGDTNTGTWSPTADNIAVSTGGTERTRILANGNMGIGTTAPTHRLNIKNDIADDGVVCVENGNTQGFTGIYFSEGNIATGYRGHIGHVNSGNTIFGFPGTYQVAAGGRDLLLSAGINGDETFKERFRIENNTGYIGINTNPSNLPAAPLPTSTLHVNGSLAIGILKISADTNLGTLIDEVSKVIVNNGATNVTITFPNASSCKGRIISISRGETSTGTVTCSATVLNQIQNLGGSLATTTNIPGHNGTGGGVNIQFWSDGVNWYR